MVIMPPDVWRSRGTILQALPMVHSFELFSRDKGVASSDRPKLKSPTDSLNILALRDAIR